MNDNNEKTSLDNLEKKFEEQAEVTDIGDQTVRDTPMAANGYDQNFVEKVSYAYCNDPFHQNFKFNEKLIRSTVYIRVNCHSVCVCVFICTKLYLYSSSFLMFRLRLNKLKILKI